MEVIKKRKYKFADPYDWEEEENFPTAAPSAFDCKPGDILSGGSTTPPVSDGTNKEQQPDKQNSARSDTKNMKSVMSSCIAPFEKEKNDK